MPDDDLRPPPARPRLAPPPGGFAEVVEGARVKRRRRASAVLGTTAAVVLLVGASVTLPGGPLDTLRPVDPVVGASGSATPGPAPRPTATGTTAPRQSSSASAGPRPTSATSVSPRAVASRTSSRAPSAPTRPSPASDMSRSVVAFSTANDCDYTAVDGDSQWCQRYAGPSRARAGVPAAMSTELCRGGRSAGTARFASTHEADVWVYSRDDAATMQWRWSTGRSFAERASAVTIEPGTCLRWTTTWSTRTDSGATIRPGVYTVRSEVRADVSQGASLGVSRERTFTVDP